MTASEPASPATPSAEDAMEGVVGDGRRRLPVERPGLTTKVVIYSDNGGTFEGYITANVDEDGRLRELFLNGFGKEGSTLAGWVNTAALLFSIALQYGAEFPMVARKLAHMKFEPYGQTNLPEIPTCRSMPDLVMQWLALRFGTDELRAELESIRRSLTP